MFIEDYMGSKVINLSNIISITKQHIVSRHDTSLDTYCLVAKSADNIEYTLYQTRNSLILDKVYKRIKSCLMMDCTFYSLADWREAKELGGLNNE